jgi:hypothetical protein
VSDTFKITAGDVAISAMNGRPVIISGQAKLKQEIQELLTIETLENGFGAGLDSLVGSVPTGAVAFHLFVDQRIRHSVDVLTAIKRRNRAQHSTDEVIEKIAYLVVSRSPSSPKDFIFRLDVVTEAGAQLRVGGALRP